MTPYLVGAGIIVLLVVLWFVFWNGGAPSVLVFQEIRDAIISLQANAAAHITKTPGDGKVPGVTQAEIEQLTRRVGGALNFAYTINEENGQLVHTVSSHLLVRKPEKYQIQCMLIAMMTFNQQLEAAGIDCL